MEERFIQIHQDFEEKKKVWYFSKSSFFYFEYLLLDKIRRIPL